MMRAFGSFMAGLRYLFVLAALALALLALGSLGRGLVRLADLAVTGGFVMDPGSGITVVPYFIRAAFLYFLAVAIGSLFVVDIPAPQWMTVKNLFQLRTKVLTFVSIILPLAFLGLVMSRDLAGLQVLYAGAGVFLVLMGIFFLTRFGSPSGDEGMAREGNKVLEVRSFPDRVKDRPAGRRHVDRAQGASADAKAMADKGRRPQKGQTKGNQADDQEEWLRKQKEELKFQKDTLEKAVEKEISQEREARQSGNVTVRPGPRRPRGRRR